MQTILNLSQPSKGSLTKFGRKFLKIFLTQPFGLSQISYHFITLINKILCIAQLSQLPT
jgi:hypothetical protein